MISSTYVIVGNDYKIELIENVPCKNKKELEKREFYFIANMDCVNTYKPGSRTKRNNEYIEHMLKLLVDKCGKDIIIKILFRYGIDQYIYNHKK
jgi:hypothetical protein